MTQPIDTPEALLDAARQVMDGQVAGTTGLWPRAGALLARQAIEEAIRSLWTGPNEPAKSSPMTHQLLCARVVLGERLAADAFQVWAALSQACHVHVYELSPVAAELAGWIETVERVLEER